MKRVHVDEREVAQTTVFTEARRVLEEAIAGNLPFALVTIRPSNGGRPEPFMSDALSSSGYLEAIHGHEAHLLAETVLELSRAMARDL